MRNTKKRLGPWALLCGAVLALYLSASAYAVTSSDSPAPTRSRCLANGSWYGFYRDNRGLKPICLKLPDAISGKMLDRDGDGVVDKVDTISDGVIFIGDDATRIPIDNGASNNGTDSSDSISPVVKKNGGSRRIMWRQIQ